MKQRKGMKVRDGLTVGMIALSLGLSLACFSDNDDDNGTNNGTNNNNNGPIIISDRVEGEATWRGTVNVKGDVRVLGKLTIEPGTTIIMCADCVLEIGPFGSAATVLANGTAEKPITIKGASAGKGFWGNVIVGENVTTNSVLSHVSIDGAGSAGSQAAAALEVYAGIGLQHIKISNAATAGVKLGAIKPGGTITVDSADGHGAIISDEAALRVLPEFTMGTLGKGSIAITDDRWSDGDITLKDYGVPYYIPKEVKTSGANVTLNAGTKFVMGPDSLFDFAWSGSSGTLKIEGTAAKPVVFEGEVKEPGSWQGIRLNRETATTSSIKHLEVHYGGSDDYGALYVDSKIALNDVRIQNAKSWGLDVGDKGLKSGSANVTVIGTQGYPIRTRAEAVLDTPVGGEFTGNTKQMVFVMDYNNCNNSQRGVLKNPGIPYLFDGEVRLIDAEWTIEAGVELRIRNDKYIYVGWSGNRGTVVAEGTADKPVIFDSVSGERNSWMGLAFHDSGGRSSLKHTIIRNAQSEPIHFARQGAAIVAERVIDIENCTIQDAGGNGIIFSDADMPGAVDAMNKIAAGNTFLRIGGKNVCAHNFPGDMFKCD
jgi:hypothetical protein